MENGGTKTASVPEVIHILSARVRFRGFRNVRLRFPERTLRVAESFPYGGTGGRHGESGPDLSVRRAPVAGADRRPAFRPAMSVRPHAAADGKVVRNGVCRERKSGFGSVRNPVFRLFAAEGAAARFDRHVPKNEHAPRHSPRGMQAFGFGAQQRSYRYVQLPNFSPSFPASTVMTLPRSIRPARISFDSSLTR